jgi:beta-1,4-N-acetylglucosaminyltransferase
MAVPNGKGELLRVLVVLGSGGHTAQMIRLVGMLSPDHEYAYMVGLDDQLSETKITRKGEIYRVHRARRHEDGLLKTVVKVLRLSFESLGVLRKAKPDAIINAGPGTAVPIAILGKIFGKKIITLEDWSRVYSRSRSGRILYHFSDLFFVQWPEMVELYPKAVYAGRLS